MAFQRLNLLQVTVLGKALNQRIVNVFHYRAANLGAFPAPGVDMAEYANDFIAGWRLNFLPLLSAEYQVETYQLRSLVGVFLEPTTPPRVFVGLGDAFDEAGHPTDDQGDKAGDILPTFVAVGVRKVTDKAGRRFRGNFRMGPIIEADTEKNSLTPALRTQWTAAVQAFDGVLLQAGFGTDANLEMAVFSETTALSDTPPQLDMYRYTARVVNSIVNPFLTSQVSRKERAFVPT